METVAPNEEIPLTVEECEELLTEADQVITKCDVAIQEQKHALRKLQVAFDTQFEYSVDTQRRLDDANDKLSSPLRNPLFMGGMGVVLGTVLTIIFVK